MYLKMKAKKILIKFSFIFLLLLSLTSFVFSSETGNVNDYVDQLEEIINSSSAYSAFQTSMMLKSAQSLIDAGISYEDTEEILENSVDNSLNAYNIKKVFDVILEAQEEGLPSDSLINKVNEGFAKNVDDNIIIAVVFTKAENLKKASEILNETGTNGLEINGGDELLQILASSLENDVPENSLSWLIESAASEGKSIQEISEISEEFSNLSLMAADIGLTPEEISLNFEEAISAGENLEDIFAYIQNSLESEINNNQLSGEGRIPTISESDSISPSSSTGSPAVEIGSTPTQESGEAPSASPADSEPTPSPADEESSPPEN